MGLRISSLLVPLVLWAGVSHAFEALTREQNIERRRNVEVELGFRPPPFDPYKGLSDFELRRRFEEERESRRAQEDRARENQGRNYEALRKNIDGLDTRSLIGRSGGSPAPSNGFVYSSPPSSGHFQPSPIVPTGPRIFWSDGVTLGPEHPFQIVQPTAPFNSAALVTTREGMCLLSTSEATTRANWSTSRIASANRELAGTPAGVAAFPGSDNVQTVDLPTGVALLVNFPDTGDSASAPTWDRVGYLIDNGRSRVWLVCAGHPDGVADPRRFHTVASSVSMR